MADPQLNLGSWNFLCTWLGLDLGLSTRLDSMRVLVVDPEQFHNEFPGWDPFWSRILTFHISALLAGRRCHCTLGVGSFDPSLTVESFVDIHFFDEVIKKDNLTNLH